MNIFMISLHNIVIVYQGFLMSNIVNMMTAER